MYRFPVAVATALLVACTNGPDAMLTPTSAPQASATGALTSHFDAWDTFPIAGITTCTGDPFVGTVTMHTSGGDVSNANSYAARFHTNYHLEGTSATGRRYIGSGASTWNFSFVVGAGFNDYTRETARLIAQGNSPDDDIVVMVVVRFHFSANGQLQQEIVEFSQACQ